MGAIVATIGRSKLDSSLPHVPAATRAALANGLGSGGTVAGHASGQIVAAVREAFVSALGTGLTVGAAMTLAGAALAWFLMRAEAASRPGHAARAPRSPRLHRRSRSPALEYDLQRPRSRRRKVQPQWPSI